MKNYLFFVGALTLACSCISCKKTQTYAELVANEKEAINTWISNDPQSANFGNIIAKDEEWVNDITEDILEDYKHPEQCGLELGQWYRITEGDFKRLYFRINSWGDEGSEMAEVRAQGLTPTDEQYKAAVQYKTKFSTGKDVLVRYDHLYNISTYDYEDETKNVEGDNFDANSYLTCNQWSPSYYAVNYYAYSYGTSDPTECTSGGLAFPIRFLWEGGNASIICPFSLVEQAFASYYFTLYYGEIQYTKPNFKR